MPNLSFTIEFYKIQTLPNKDKSFSYNEKVKIIGESLDYAEALTFFISECAKNNQLDADTSEIYFDQMRCLADKFFSTARAMLYEITEEKPDD